jgi:hypothetical protein
MNQFFLMAKKRIIPLLFFLIASNSILAEGEDKKESFDISSLKKEVIEFYQPPECFQIMFRTNLNIPGYGVQSADGSVRADNVNNRIRIILTEANLGITISWITVINNTAYLTNPRQEGILKMPVEKLQLGSFVNNNIQMPFSLFQDILFGRLPNALIQSEQWFFEENQLRASYMGEDGSTIKFYFLPTDRKRIQKIEYINPKINYLAIANFEGKFYDTKYPKSVNINTYQGKKPLESMGIFFYRYIDKAWCKDEYFPIK